MPFLQVNGYTIPVASVRRKDLLLGGRSRAYDGTPQTQDRGRKQIFECKTSPLAEQARKTIIGIIRGDGFVWPWDSDLYSHKGVGPATGTDQATQLDYLAADGAVVSLMSYLDAASESNYTPTRNGLLSVDPDTTNILPAAQRDAEGDPLNDYTGLGGAVLANDTTHFHQGVQSLKVTGNALNDGAYADEDPGAGSATKTYVGSAYIKNQESTATDIKIQLQDATNVALGPSVAMSVPAGAWVRLAATITIGGLDCRALQVRVSLSDNPGGAVVFNVDSWQIEEQDYPTAWVDGARGGADDLAYDFDFDYSFVDWSIGVWFWGPAVARVPGATAVIVDIYDAAVTADAALWRPVASQDIIRWSVSTALATVDLDTGAGDVDWEAWNFVGVSLRTDPETGESSMTMRLINGSGSTTYTSTAPATFSLDRATRIDVGNAGSALPWFGHLGEMILFPFAVPVGVWDGIASTMGRAGDGTAAALPLPQWPRKLVTGDALVAYPIDARSRSDGSLFEGDVGSIDMLYGDGRNNLGAVAFTLEEV